MAFEFQDPFNQYVKRTGSKYFANVSRSDEAATSPRYYGFQNENGSYVIQRVTTTGGVGVYDYFASKNIDTFSANWTNRASLSYVEFYLLFQQTN